MSFDKGQPETGKNPITVPIEVSRQDIDDLVVTAIEGGCQYWTRQIRVEGRRKSSGRHAPLGYLDCKITFVEAVDERNPTDDEEHILDLTTINLSQVQAGLSAMAEVAPHHFANFISGDVDAETADVFIQVTLFGEIRYG